MSCLDCSCILRTPVESIRPEKQSQSSSHESLADSELAWIPPSKGGNEMIFCSSNVSHYELQVEIGRRFNNLTSVYLARHTPTGMQVAVRITDLESCSEEHLKALQNEVVLSHFFQHPNIMTLWTVFTAGSWLWVISPFMAYGDGLVSLSGLNNLYSLVNNGQKSKVVYDFPQFSTSVLPWLSPELLRQDLSGYNMKSDIYSVGITACELANGHVPFQDMPRTQMLLQKLKGPTYYPWDINAFPHGESRMKNSQSGVDSGISESMTHTMTSERLQNPVSKTFSPAFYNLVELCLQQDPEKRPSASSLLSHTFFKQVKEQTQSSLLSLLPPPAQNNRSELLTLPSAAAEAEFGCITANQHDTDWEF
ncbi:STE20-related kinase adapter protein beta isoform X3 [Numida meleagris]|uniref:STE20-related kinase adapter protein beta isoform X3 n=1 Tax=Numida meleagris TaxID=8996 RepID=UPI000B3DD194|nr:STE20-related kinase adapter protein beta isoform X3 [Numida meleagris]